MEKEVQDVIEKGISDINSKIDTTSKQLEDLSTKNVELESKIKLLEERPIVSKGVNFIIPEFYKGKNLHRQLVKQRETMARPELADLMAKAVIDVSRTPGLTIQQATAKTIAPNNETGAESGGNLVLDEFDDMITKIARNNSVMAALVDNVTVGQTDTLKINSQSRSPILTWDNEGTVTAASAGYGQTSISIKRLSGYVAISNELLADNVYDIVGDITEQFGYGVGQELDKQILSGTGTPVSGLTTAACGYSVVLAAAGSEAFSSVTGTDYSLAITNLTTIDSMNAQWVLGVIAAHYVRTLKDSNNAWIYQQMSGGVPSQIWGKPMSIANNITSTSAAGTAFAVFGDFKQFILAHRIGTLELMVDPYSDSVSYNTRFIYATRKGMGYRRNTAFVRLMTGS